MRPRVRALCAVALLGLSGWHAALADAVDPPEALQDALSFHHSACIAPHYADADEGAVIAALTRDPAQAEAMLARLVRGAPVNWQPLADRAMPLDARMRGAVGMLGMAISHGTPRERAVAQAYIARYLPVPPRPECALPDGLDAFLEHALFWPPPDAPSSPLPDASNATP